MASHSKPVKIAHTCGHAVEHRAWGPRIKWLKTKPCPACAGFVKQQAQAVFVEELSTLVYRTVCDAGLPSPLREFRFCKARRFRFDYAWPDKKIALEVEGSPGQGRHTRAAGFIRDCEKYNLALSFGWRVFRCSRSKVGKTVSLLASSFGSDTSATNPPYPPQPQPPQGKQQEGKPPEVFNGSRPGLPAGDTRVDSHAKDPSLP